jgi:hypothetical protein
MQLENPPELLLPLQGGCLNFKAPAVFFCSHKKTHDAVQNTRIMYMNLQTLLQPQLKRKRHLIFLNRLCNCDEKFDFMGIKDAVQILVFPSCKDLDFIQR